LSGSYARWTKTRPLKDVDVFCVLREDEAHYRKKHPRELLKRIASALVPTYGKEFVTIDRMAVTVDFGVEVDANDETGERVMSIDVVPAFAKGGHYEIPDATAPGWIATNPETHADLATEAQEAYDGEWKPLVRMIKKWNRHTGEPVKPGFLLETIALDTLIPPFSGGYAYELKAFFATAAARICEDWSDPAGLGPPVNGEVPLGERESARSALLRAETEATQAILLERAGRRGDALRTWRNLFGPQFPLS
jgi:hypothetical protein